MVIRISRFFRRGNQTAKVRFTWILLIVGIMWLGTLIRVWNVTKESFWADEGWTMLLSKGPTLSDVVQAMANDQHPPLYFALMHFWIAATGNSEFTTRFLSTIWSVLGIALIYRLGADQFSPEVGAVAALLLALADNDTFLAQDARHYTQMAALATCSTLFYLRYLRTPTRQNGIGWLLSSVALMYTHYLGAFILVIQLVHILLFARPTGRLKDMLIRWAAIGLAWSPWAVVVLEQSLIRYTRPILSQSAWANTPESFNIVRGDLLGSQFGLTGGLLLLGLAYITYANGLPRIRLRPFRPTSYMALWLFVPVIAIVLVNIKYPILTTRNFLLITPVIAVLIAHGIMNLDLTARRFILVLLVVVDLFTVDAYFIKPPYRQLALDILKYRTTGEAIIMNLKTDDFALMYHLGRDLGIDPETLPIVSVAVWQDRYGQNFDAYLLQFLTDKTTFWLANWGEDVTPLLTFFTDHGFVRTATQVETHLETNKIFVYRYDRPLTQALATFGSLIDLTSFSADLVPSGDGKTNLRVNFLWRDIKQTPVDYSISIFLLNTSGAPVFNQDSPPLDGKSPTTSWKPGDLRFDSHLVNLPTNLPSGQYAVGVTIYWYADPNNPLPVTTSSGEGLVRDPHGLILKQISLGQ